MKNIHKIAALSAMTLAAFAATTTGCIDGNDWDEDGNYAKTFSPIKFSASQTAEGATTVLFESFSMPGSAFYQIECSTDSFVQETPNDKDLHEVAKSPATLDVITIMDTTYYARVRAYSETTGFSAWTTLEKYKFKVKSMQIMNAVAGADITPSTITVTWRSGNTVTRIEYGPEGGEMQSVDLSAEELEACSKTFSDLESMTTYNFVIYNGTAACGKATATTSSSGPEAEYMAKFDPEQTMGDQLAAIAAQAEADGKTAYSVTMVIPAGVVGMCCPESPDTENDFILPNGMSITFYGESGNAADELYLWKSIGVDGSHTSIKFNNLTLTGPGYVINQKNACSVDSVIVEDCNVKVTGNTFLRTQKAEATIKNIVLRNTWFDTVGKGYGLLHYVYVLPNSVLVDGCTFSNICTTGKCFFMVDKQNDSDPAQMMESFIITNSTFYNFCGNGQYFLDFGKNGINGATTYELSNCIFGKTPDEATNKNIRGAIKDILAINCYSTTDCFKVLKGVTALEVASDGIFTDPANGNFTLKTGVLSENVGDPRWFPAE